MHDPHDKLEVIAVRRRCAVELEVSSRVANVDPVQEARVEVHVQVQARTESLNEGDRARSRSVAASDADALRPAPVPLSDRVGEDPRERSEHLRVERGERAKLEGEREHPLTHGNRGQDAIDESRRLVRHPPTRAARAQTAKLARERCQ